MLTQEQNETLTRTAPGTPMGELMRRYWIPVLLDWEVEEPEGEPVMVTLLGEELLAFRQTDGQVGLVGARCAHRRAHLFYGRNEEDGIRCVYHGWKYDIAGQCVDMPNEPVASNFRDKVRIPAYPTHEAGGVIWAYLGPKDKQPEPPLYEWTQVPADYRTCTKVVQECNWLQALEGGIDSSHINFLHGGRPPAAAPMDASTVMGRARRVSLATDIQVVPTDYGYAYAGLRSMGDEGNYVRAYHWIMPWTQLRPNQINAAKPRISGHMWVPIDDLNTTVWNFSYTFGSEPLTAEERTQHGTGNAFGTEVDPKTFRSFRTAANFYLIDRKVQKTRTYSGIQGTNTQDRAVQESMGSIADRTLERLGTADRAIITTRRQLMHAVQALQHGVEPPGVAPTYYKLRSIERVLPVDANWLEAMRPDIFQLEEPLAATPV